MPSEPVVKTISKPVSSGGTVEFESRKATQPKGLFFNFYIIILSA